MNGEWQTCVATFIGVEMLSERKTDAVNASLKYTKTNSYWRIESERRNELWNRMNVVS